MCDNPVPLDEFYKNYMISRRSRPSIRMHFNNIKVPCGNCLGCRIDNLLLWTARCNYEYYKGSSAFVTLTYDKYHCPRVEHSNEPTLSFDDCHKFIDNLRHKTKGVNCRGIRQDWSYFGCGEYGLFNQRCHLHFLFFGLDFEYCSKLFRDTWKKGFVKSLPILSGGVRYVVDYFSKEKLTGDLAIEKYDNYGLERPFKVCSRGLGSELFFNHRDEIRNGDVLKIGSRLIPVPTYYKNLYSRFSDDEIRNRMTNQAKSYDKILSDSIRSGYSDVDVYLNDLRRAREKNLESDLRSRGVPVISSYKKTKSYMTKYLASSALA